MDTTEPLIISSSNLDPEKDRTFYYENINFEEIDDDLATFQEDEMVQQALHRGVDLKKYGAELEKELRNAEMESVSEFVAYNQQFLDLHGEMQDCDRILGRMEEMLRGFQADLGEISSEIKHLQDDSLFMNVKLKNRRAVEEKLNLFLEKTSIPSSLTSNIMHPTVNEAFLEAVIILADRLKYLEQVSAPHDGSSLDIPPAETFAGRTLLPELEKLKIKAISKIKDYFTTQISLIRKPKTNIQILQQNSLLKYSPLFHFIQRENGIVADDLRAVYVESMSKTLLNVFKSYYAQLSKFEMVVATKNDLIVVEEAAIKSLFTQKIDMTKRTDSFALSGREKILEQVEKEPILLHVAIAENQKLPYESILRSILKHLVDAASNEFLFVIDFFKTSPKDTFNRIFGKTISLLLENIENHLLSCYDSVGILLMIKMTYMMRLVMQRRRIPVLDPFFDRLSLLLWPRFKQIFDANLKSVKNANPRKFLPIDCSPHLISRRYAEFISSVILLSGHANTSVIPVIPTEDVSPTKGDFVASDSLGIGGSGENMIQQDIQMIRQEIIALLDRVAALFTNVKDQKVFFINNYDQIIQVFQEKQLLSDEIQKFEDLLMHQRELFAEEEIKAFFPKLIAFVLQAEKSMHETANSGGKFSVDDAMAENLVREFSQNWRSGIQQINDDVLAYFGNFATGMEILKQVLTQLLLYYTRFQDIIKKAYTRAPAFTRDIVSTATILMEIKRYSRTF